MSNPDYMVWRETAANLSNQARAAIAGGDYDLAQTLAAQAQAYIKQCNAAVEDKQYLVGIMMAIDNIAALILLPIFGSLSDKTKTPIGICFIIYLHYLRNR